MKTAFILPALLIAGLALWGCAAQEEVQTLPAPSRGAESGTIGGSSQVGGVQSGVGSGGEAVGAAAANIGNPGR